MKELQDLMLQLRHLDGEMLQLQQVRRVIFERACEVYERDNPGRNFLIDYVAINRAEDDLWNKLDP